MSPDDALVAIEAVLLQPSPGQRQLSDEIREILAQVQPRYWLAPQVDGLVEAYKLGDFGRVHRIIDLIIERDQGARS